ncbi:hypothetical protein ACFS5N_04075 [Mucilaginibacter ximonensis]|uniref:Uncharacterized protein n=1 Tax=Mucilaginibacter ximonensis TaxID=538021 RepID=A0ABW5Y8D4_9SPHI
MKKKDTMVFQSDKPEADSTEAQISKNNYQKMYRDHRSSDYYTHGRRNKFPFGSSQGPLYF